MLGQPCSVTPHWSSGGRASRHLDRLACAPAMADVSSAIPNDLISYGGNAESHNGQLRDWATSVTTALDALRKSKPDPGLLPAVPDLGASLNAYAVKKEAIDKFVYDVGMAFMTVSNSDWMSPVTLSDDALNKELDK